MSDNFLIRFFARLVLVKRCSVGVAKSGAASHCDFFVH